LELTVISPPSNGFLTGFLMLLQNKNYSLTVYITL